MKIVVLAGGLSDERDVSLSSGAKIANALMAKGHQVLLMDLYLGISDASDFDSAYSKYGQNTYHYDIPDLTPDLKELIIKNKGRESEIGINVVPICQTSDLVFLALHGGIGENGKLQAFFDLHYIKYTGSDYKSSLLAMDKIVSKTLMASNHIVTPKWTVCDSVSQNRLSAPAVVKPNDNGSSIGVKIAEKETDLKEAIQEARLYSESILIEEKIEGREFSVGILNRSALPVIELIPKQGFYDYQNKYQVGATEEITPAVIDDKLKDSLQELALDVFKLLQLSVYARIDFIVDANNRIYCIEANSLPGMTPTSLLPQEALANGISYENLCQQIVDLSLKKYKG
ncbi:D-alanine--D-alanine ligase [Streptococcus didelphis]|uniref:D-alanine--D-alanine ligase n=2 Tax=Streptococcus didelphis TaxID=102886 RepID=A0ABY9LGE2_9STRE|nr:D-alanine--D-alanine ligase [Streptococcus didelphis]WMB27929.1 D-alanine--D-alanine ligase [Streptococcus didelphis]